MNIVKEICFWIILSAGMCVALIGLGMLFDTLLKRYMVYKEIYSGFISYMTKRIRDTKQNKQD